MCRVEKAFITSPIGLPLEMTYALVMDSVSANTEPIVRILMTEPDELAAKQVAIDGHHMKLKGVDRLEAIRLMAARRINAKEMALRLRITVDHLRKLAKDAKIDIPKEVEPVHWSFHYIFARDEKARQRQRADARERTRRYRARQRESS